MRRTVLLVVALAVVAASCASGTEATSTVPGSEAPVTTSPVTTSPVTASPVTASPVTTTPPGAEESATTVPTVEGPAAPDFTLALGDGGEFTLSAEQKPVYMVFWAEW